MRKKLLVRFFVAALIIVVMALFFLFGIIYKLTNLPVGQVLKAILVPAIVFLILALGASYVLAQKLYETALRPFQSIASYLLNLTRGDYSAEAPPIEEEKALSDFLLDEEDRKAFSNQLSEIRENENMRRQFTANISHELKNPLTSINGYAEMLEKGMAGNPEKVQDYASIIHREGKRLMTIIDQVIELSRFDTGMVNMNDLKEFNITEMVGKKLKEMKDYAKLNNVSLYAQVGAIQDKDDMEDKPFWEDVEEGGSEPKVMIRAKKNLIDELLDNLISNAIRYSKKDGSKVRIRVSEDEDSVYLSVKDKGIGISKEDCDHIFERFYVVNRIGDSKEEKGTGLGLSLVKHAVQAHKGSYSVKSKLDKGSKFTITLPKNPHIKEPAGKGKKAGKKEKSKDK